MHFVSTYLLKLMIFKLNMFFNKVKFWVSNFLKYIKCDNHFKSTFETIHYYADFFYNINSSLEMNKLYLIL